MEPAQSKAALAAAAAAALHQGNKVGAFAHRRASFGRIRFRTPLACLTPREPDAALDMLPAFLK